MATEVLELVVRVSGTGQASSDIDRLTKSTSSLTSALRFMRNALVLFSFGRLALGVVELLDSFVTMQNKLVLVTRDLNEVNIATEALAQIAIRSRSPLDATTTLFTRMARSLTNLHLTYGELLDITEATNKALIISGATTDEARNAIVQFTQGLALGVLRGQDLKSVVEFAPRLAQVLADGLSKSSAIVKQFGENFHLAGGQLYSFVTAHKNILTSQIAIEAYKDALSALNIEFDKTKPTIQQAFTNLTTAVTLFIGRASAANGVVGGLVSAIDFVREHLNAFAEGLTIFAGLVVFRLLTTEVLRFGALTFSVLRTTIAGFLQLGAVMAKVGLQGSLLIRSFVGFAILAGVIYGTIVLLQSLGITFGDVLDFVERFIANVWAEFQFLGVLFKSTWATLELAALDALNFVSRAWTAFWNNFRSEKKEAFQFDTTGLNEKAGAASKFSFSGAAEQNLSKIKGLVSEVQGYFDKLGTGGVSKEQIDIFRQLQAALSGTSKSLANTAADTERARASLLDFLRQISPYAAAKAKIADLDAKIAAAVKKGVDVQAIWNELGFGQVEAQRRLTREVIGIGNATTDYSERLQVLNEGLRTNALTQYEAGEQAREARIKYLSFGRDVASGVESAVLKLDDLLAHKEKIGDEIVTQALAQAKADQLLVIQTEALTDAVNRNVISEAKKLEILRQQNIARLELDHGSAGAGVTVAKLKIEDELSNVNKITADVTTQALASKTAFQTLEVQTLGLNTALAQGVINGEQYDRTLRDLQITALGTNTDTVSGFQKGLLEVQKSMADTAGAASQIVVGAFGQMTDALTTFATTGKLSIGDLLNSITTGLIKLAIQQEIMAPLAASLGLGGGAAGGADRGALGGLGGLFGSAQGASGGGGLGGLLGSFASNANGNVGSGIFGALSDFGGFLGFADGGSFNVGGQGGTDSQLVAFRASPDENVSVTKPGQKNQSHAAPISVALHIYGATDPNSFKASEGQIAASAAGAMRRAQTRNGRG